MNAPRRTIPGDWYPGELPENVQISPTAYVGSSYSFAAMRSELAAAVVIEDFAALYDTAVLSLGVSGRVRLGRYSLVSGGVHLLCQTGIDIGDYTMVAWDTVIMDSYLLPLALQERRIALEALSSRPSRTVHADPAARPIHIGTNVWISFGACVLPGVTIGDGSIVGAHAVVVEDVPAYAVVAGNPARVVRQLSPAECTQASDVARKAAAMLKETSGARTFVSATTSQDPERVDFAAGKALAQQRCKEA